MENIFHQAYFHIQIYGVRSLIVNSVCFCLTPYAYLRNFTFDKTGIFDVKYVVKCVNYIGIAF